MQVDKNISFVIKDLRRRAARTSLELCLEDLHHERYEKERSEKEACSESLVNLQHFLAHR